MKKVFILFAMLASISLSHAEIIKVDGDFSDWGAVPKVRLYEASIDSDAAYKNLYNMKWCADANYLYFYYEFSYDTSKKKNLSISTFLNTDDDETTGYRHKYWNNMAADYLYEVLWCNDTLWTNVAYFPDYENQFEWAWNLGYNEYVNAVCEVQTLANGHQAIEGKMLVEMIPYYYNSPRNFEVGVIIYDKDYEWWESGCLPQMNLSNGDTTLSPMLTVLLPDQCDSLSYSIRGEVNDIEMGSVSVPFTVCHDSTITAYPKNGYHFVQWSDGDTINPRNIELTQDTIFTAEFAPNQYTIIVLPNDTAFGEIIGSGKYDYNTQATITAVPKEGYEFLGFIWPSYKSYEAVYDNPYTFKVVENRIIQAYFSAKKTENINNNEIKMTGYKFLRDGQLLIKRNGKIYTITGIEVK